MSEEIQNQAAAAEAAAPAPKLSRAEKQANRLEVLRKRIEADTQEYNEIANELNNAAALANLKAGDVVQVKLGRKFADKDTTRVVVATIVAIRDVEGEAIQYKVSYGEGFNAELAVIEAGKIVAVGYPTTEPEVVGAAA